MTINGNLVRIRAWYIERCINTQKAWWSNQSACQPLAERILPPAAANLPPSFHHKHELQTCRMKEQDIRQQGVDIDRGCTQQSSCHLFYPLLLDLDAKFLKVKDRVSSCKIHAIQNPFNFLSIFYARRYCTCLKRTQLFFQNVDIILRKLGHIRASRSVSMILKI